MAITRSQPITQADLNALATLANDMLLPLVNENIVGDGSGALDTAWAFSGGVVEGWAGANYYDIPASTADGVQYNKVPQPPYNFSGTSANWLSELNRIRGDYWNLIFGMNKATPPAPISEGLYLNPENIISGPWVVGVNDPVTFPMTKWNFNSYHFYQPGYYENLVGSFPSNNADAFTIFRGVRFYYASDDAQDGVTISTGRIVQWTSVATTTDFSLDYVAAKAGSWNVKIVWQFQWVGGGTPPPAPPISEFAFTVTGGAAISWQSTELDSFNNSADWATPPYPPVGPGFYILRGEFTMDVPVGSGTVEITATTVPAGFSMLIMLGSSFIEFSSSSAVTASCGLHPSSDIEYVAGDDQPEDSNFQLNGVYADASWRVDPSVNGVWVANTLPVPGLNVFLDQDMPPYVGDYRENYNGDGALIAVSPNLVQPGAYSLDNPPTGQYDNGSPIFASSMRQQALLQDGPKYNLIEQSCQPQATQWLIRRDTDFVPFDFGFTFKYNQGETIFEEAHPAIADPLNTGLYANYYSLAVYSSVKAIKIRLVASGSTEVGWKDGQFQYGDELETELKILVALNSFSAPFGADFSTTNNEVTIDGTATSDGGVGYLAELIGGGALNFAIQNPTATDVEYDLIIEVDFVVNPQRQYFPLTTECFSYSIDGTLPGNYSVAYGPVEVKPVPQSGYCIFKVRATRLPVQNGAGISITPTSGDEIKIILGQNRLQLDNTLTFTPFMQTTIQQIGAGDTGTGAGDMGTGAGGTGQSAITTITIPADARDSGDVDVFIPVLAGNELVYQCSEQIILEAWANWQPVFFSGQYGTFSPYASFDATAFQYCLAFTNFFNPWVSNYPGFYPGFGGSYPQAPKVQFPPSVEIYNDLEACLSLI